MVAEQRDAAPHDCLQLGVADIGGNYGSEILVWYEAKRGVEHHAHI